MLWNSVNLALERITHAKSQRLAWLLVSDFVAKQGLGRLVVVELQGAADPDLARLAFVSNPRLQKFLNALPVHTRSKSAFPALFSPMTERVSNAARLFTVARQPTLRRLAKLFAVSQIHTYPLWSASRGNYCAMVIESTTHISQELEAALVALCYAAIADRKEPLVPIAEFGFTSREKECARLLAAGLDDTEMSVRIGISERTVRFHIDGAKAKVGVKTRTQLVAIIASGLPLELLETK